MEQQRLEQQQRQQQQRQQPNGSTSPRQPLAGQSSRFAGYEAPPFPEEEPQAASRSAPTMQQSREGDPRVPSQQGSPGHQPGMPPDGHPFNSAAVSEVGEMKKEFIKE